MAWTLPQSTKTIASLINGVGSLAYGSNVKAGSLLVVCTDCNSGSQTVAITDSLSNSYTNVSPVADATNGKSACVSWAISKAAGANTVTATFSGLTTITGALIIHEFSGNAAGTDVVDKSTNNTNGSGSTSTDGVTSGSVTTTFDGDLIFGWTTDASALATTIAAGTGFTEAQNSGISALEDCETEYFVQTSHGAIAATWTYSASNPYEAIIVAFRPLIPFMTANSW